MQYQWGYIANFATGMKTTRSKVGSTFVPVTKTTLPKYVGIGNPEGATAKVEEEEDFEKKLFSRLPDLQKFRISCVKFVFAS